MTNNSCYNVICFSVEFSVPHHSQHQPYNFAFDSHFDKHLVDGSLSLHQKKAIATVILDNMKNKNLWVEREHDGVRRMYAAIPEPTGPNPPTQLARIHEHLRDEGQGGQNRNFVVFRRTGNKFEVDHIGPYGNEVSSSIHRDIADNQAAIRQRAQNMARAQATPQRSAWGSPDGGQRRNRFGKFSRISNYGGSVGDYNLLLHIQQLEYK